jgi:hypothetical protein
VPVVTSLPPTHTFLIPQFMLVSVEGYSLVSTLRKELVLVNAFSPPAHTCPHHSALL